MGFPSLRDFLADKSWHGCTVAHRGAWHQTAENSLRSIDHAVALGCDFAEIDVQETIDGVPFCLHDISLLRTTGRTVSAAAHDWKQISGTPLLHGLGGRGAEITDQVLPSFEQILESAKDRIYLDLDVKRPHQLPRIAKAVHAVGTASQVNLKMWIHGRADLDFALSVQEDLGIMLKPILLVERENLEQMLQVIQALDAPMVETYFDRWETVLRLADFAWSEGRDIFVNTLDEVPSTFVLDSAALLDPHSTWGVLLDAGVRIVQTDEPEALCDYLKIHRKAKG